MAGALLIALGLWVSGAGAQGLPSGVFIQVGHSGEVTRIKYSPDGRQLATASHDGTVKLWDVDSRREIYTFREHASIVNDVAFTPDGSHLLTAGAEPDKSVHVVERTSGRSVRRLVGHPAGVSAVAPLPDNRHALSVGEKGAVVLWDYATGSPLRQWTLDVPWLKSVAIAPDATSAVLGAANGRIFLVSLPEGTVIREYPKQEWSVVQVAFDPDGRYFVTAAGGMLGQQKPAVVQWPLDSDRPLRRLEGPPGTVLDLAISRDGRRIAAAGADSVLGSFGAYRGPANAVWAWNASDGALRERWIQSARWDPARGVTAVAFAPDGRSLAYARKDRRIAAGRLDRDDPATVHFDGRAAGRRLLAIAPDGGSAGVATSIEDAGIAGARRASGATRSATQFNGVYRVARWNLRTGSRDHVQDRHNSQVLAIAAGTQGEYHSFSATREYTPVDPDTTLAPECADARSEPCVKWLIGHLGSGPAPRTMREVIEGEERVLRQAEFDWHPRAHEGDGKLATEEALRYQSPWLSGTFALSRSGRRAALALTPHAREITAEALSAERPVDIVVFDRTADGHRVLAVLRSPRTVTAVAFTGDDSGLLAGICEPSDKEKGPCRKGVRLHRGDIATGQWSRADAIARSIDQIAVSPNGQFAVTTGDHGAVGWHAADLKVAAVLREEGASVRVSRRVAWSPDQSRLAVASYGRTVQLWDTNRLRLERSIKGMDGLVDDMAFTPDGKRLVTVTDDGALRVWDVGTGALIATMTEFDDGEWIAVIPEGYFVSSAAGDRQLNVRHGDRVYGMDQFYDVFYRPDIVERRLAGSRIDDLVTLTIEDALNRPPPHVALGAPVKTGPETVRLTVTAATAGGGVGDVRIFHNGKLVSSDAERYRRRSTPRPETVPRPVEQNARGLEAVLRRAVAQSRRADSPAEKLSRTVELRLAPGENRVWAVGFNGDDTLQSRPVALELPARPAAPPRVFVMAIGVDRYVNENDFSTLRYAVKDARDFARDLSTRVGRVLPDYPVEVRMLADAQATRPAVEAALERLRGEMGPGDIFVWFIAGHGVLDEEAGYNVVLHDADVARPGQGMLSTARVLDWLKRLPALNQVLVIDTCHAGGLDSVVRGLYDARIAVLARSMGLHILASASARESALDGYKDNGLFTHAILRGMADPRSDLNADHRLTVKELGSFSRELTRTIAREIRFRQNPMVFHFGRDIVISEFLPGGSQ